MIHETSPAAIAIFSFFIAVVLGLSFFLGAKAKSAQGYFAAHGQVHWFVNGVAFAGDYLSAASFLGLCGMIAFYGYDGFLYSIGYLAGWVVALFVVVEPLKRLGRFTFADALDSRFNSRGIKVAAGISALVVRLFYLIPQMVGAGALIKPLLGLPHYAGVFIVGAVVVTIVVTAGMVSTTWVQFIKGSLLVVISAVAFTTVLGTVSGLIMAASGARFTRAGGRKRATVSGLIMAASGAVVHDLMSKFLKIEMNDSEKVRAGKVVAVLVGAVAMALGILFKDMNVNFLVGWAFNVAASANLPALAMLLFWKGTTKQGITAAIVTCVIAKQVR